MSFKRQILRTSLQHQRMILMCLSGKELFKVWKVHHMRAVSFSWTFSSQMITPSNPRRSTLRRRSTIPILTQKERFAWTSWKTLGHRIWPSVLSWFRYRRYWMNRTLTTHLSQKSPTHSRTIKPNSMRLQKNGRQISRCEHCRIRISEICINQFLCRFTYKAWE